MYDTTQCKAIALVFDVSLRHLDGHRILDVVKKQVMIWLRNTLEDSEDYFYFYHPYLSEPTIHRGEAIAAVGNYNTDGWLTDLRGALSQSFWVLAAQDPDAHKHFVFVTDRLQNTDPLKKLFALEKKEQTDSQFILAGIGQHYQKKILDEFANVATIVHSETGKDLSEILLTHTGGI